MKRLLKESLDTLDTPLVLACGIPKVLTSSCLAILIRILPGVKLTERAQRGYQLLGRSLVSWCSKKQNFVALSTAEAEYIAASACCAQIDMKQTLCDYGI